MSAGALRLLGKSRLHSSLISRSVFYGETRGVGPIFETQASIMLDGDQERVMAVMSGIAPAVMLDLMMTALSSPYVEV